MGRAVDAFLETAIELDVRPDALCLTCGSSEPSRRDPADDFHLWEELPDENDQAPGSTPDVQHVVTRPETRLEHKVPSLLVES